MTEFIQSSKFAHEDFISNMPDNVTTNILDRLPLRDAVRTDILSKKWRFKWTMLSQLVFDERFFAYLSKTKDKSNYVRIITRLLLNLKGAITKCVLSIDERCYSMLDDEDISHWIRFLSRNGVKDLTIGKRNTPCIKLPMHFFSCLELRQLKLHNCFFHPPTTFHGFPNLLVLELCMVEFEKGEFFTRCPVLEVLNMSFPYEAGKVQEVEIASLTNLKILSLLLCNLEDTTITSSSAIFELPGFLPKLEELHLDFLWCKLTEGGAKKRFTTPFPCLKVLKLSKIDVGSGIMLSCVFEMIRRLPNLQTLEITACDADDVSAPTIWSPEVDYNIIGLLHLRSVVFTYLKGSENEVCLIKYLLACSPALKKIVIHPNSFLLSEEKFVFARKLLKLHRASSVVDIDLY